MNGPVQGPHTRAQSQACPQFATTISPNKTIVLSFQIFLLWLKISDCCDPKMGERILIITDSDDSEGNCNLLIFFNHFNLLTLFTDESLADLDDKLGPVQQCSTLNIVEKFLNIERNKDEFFLGLFVRPTSGEPLMIVERTIALAKNAYTTLLNFGISSLLAIKMDEPLVEEELLQYRELFEKNVIVVTTKQFLVANPHVFKPPFSVINFDVETEAIDLIKKYFHCLCGKLSDNSIKTITLLIIRSGLIKSKTIY